MARAKTLRDEIAADRVVIDDARARIQSRQTELNTRVLRENAL